MLSKQEYYPAYPVQQYPQQLQSPQQPVDAYYNPGQPPMYLGQQQQQQQQQPTVVVVQSGPAPQSFACHFFLSCCVFWCCGCLFGLVAFILAVVAESRSRQDAYFAAQLGKASIGVSISGIVVFVLIITVVTVSYAMFAKSIYDIFKSCILYTDNKCYTRKENSWLNNYCPENGYYYSADSYCYYE